MSLQFEADRLGGTVAQCPNCSREFVLSKGLLVDPRHSYQVCVPSPDHTWRFVVGHPVHSPSFCRPPCEHGYSRETDQHGSPICPRCPTQ